MKSITLLLVLMLPVTANAAPLSVVVDQSGSAPILVNQPFAKLAAEAAVKEFNAMKTGDILTYRTLGLTGFKNFGGSTDVVKKSKKRRIRKELFKKISSIPTDSAIESQEQTNILYFLNHTGFNCDAGETIFMITDALESSNYISAYDLVQGNPLPKPKENFLQGCRLVMYGMGLTETPMSPNHIDTLLKAWQDWAVIAGVDFKAVINP